MIDMGRRSGERATRFEKEIAGAAFALIVQQAVFFVTRLGFGKSV